MGARSDCPTDSATALSAERGSYPKNSRPSRRRSLPNWGYGNTVSGFRTVGGETNFTKAIMASILVNAMCGGLALGPIMFFYSAAKGVVMPIFYVGIKNRT